MESCTADCIIEQEHYCDALRDELLPLIVRNWRESPSYVPGVDADPDWQRYRLLDEAGAVLCLTVRKAGALVGYLVAFSHSSLHHRTIRCAQIDGFYILPAFRFAARRLYRMAEDHFIAAGITHVGWTVDRNSRLQALAQALGFRADETVMEKLLCAL